MPLLPYQKTALQDRLGRAPRLALAAADLYALGGGAAASGALPLPHDAFAPLATGAHTFLRFGAGALALGHGIAGVRGLLNADGNRLQQGKATADLTAAAGLAGQAFGLGPWTAIVALAGVLTATTLSQIHTSEGQS